MTGVEFERKFNVNTLLQLVVLGFAAAAVWSNAFADYRGTGETVVMLKQQLADQQKGLQTLSAKVIEVQQMFATKLADSQFQTATKLVGIERDVDYIKKAVERLEKASAPR